MMPTQYRFSMIAEHGLKMGLAPEGKVVLANVEKAIERSGLQPVAGQIERIDDNGPEFAGMIHRAPDIFILGMAKVFEGELAQRMDPDSDKYDPKFCTGEPWVELIDLARDIIEKREAAKASGEVYLAKDIS